ncbi:hypothetical protein ACROYT_G024081 [Oculina patagonica]
MCPPRIELTSDSPGQSKKRLYSPARERAASKDKEEKLAKIKKKEKRREIKSLWLPKKKTSLPMMQATMVQPAVPEQTKEQGGRGRLTFTLHYHYQYASKSSVLLVKLVSAQDLPLKDDEEFLDVFVKTQLVPSRKRVYISKVHRETSNPVFNESYEFDIEYQELQQQRLLFQILDYDCMSRYKPVDLEKNECLQRRPRCWQKSFSKTTPFYNGIFLVSAVKFLGGNHRFSRRQGKATKLFPVPCRGDEYGDCLRHSFCGAVRSVWMLNLVSPHLEETAR